MDSNWLSTVGWKSLPIWARLIDHLPLPSTGSNQSELMFSNHFVHRSYWFSSGSPTICMHACMVGMSGLAPKSINWLGWNTIMTSLNFVNVKQVEHRLVYIQQDSHWLLYNQSINVKAMPLWWSVGWTNRNYWNSFLWECETTETECWDSSVTRTLGLRLILPGSHCEYEFRNS